MSEFPYQIWQYNVNCAETVSTHILVGAGADYGSMVQMCADLSAEDDAKVAHDINWPDDYYIRQPGEPTYMIYTVIGKAHSSKEHNLHQLAFSYQDARQKRITCERHIKKLALSSDIHVVVRMRNDENNRKYPVDYSGTPPDDSDYSEDSDGDIRSADSDYDDELYELL